MGRPTDYTPEIAATICERLAGGETLAAICREDAMPGRSTVYQWLAANEAFADSYARAKVDRLEVMADEIVDIADSGGDPQANRLRVDVRKWLLSKLAARTYGDKIDLAHSGGFSVSLNGSDAKL